MISRLLPLYALPLLVIGTHAFADATASFKKICQFPQWNETEAELTDLRELSQVEVTQLEESFGNSLSEWNSYFISENSFDVVFLNKQPDNSTCTVAATSIPLADVEDVWSRLQIGLSSRTSGDMRIRERDGQIRGGGFMASPIKDDVFVQTTMGLSGSPEQLLIILTAVTVQASPAACELYPERCN